MRPSEVYMKPWLERRLCAIAHARQAQGQHASELNRERICSEDSTHTRLYLVCVRQKKLQDSGPGVWTV